MMCLTFHGPSHRLVATFMFLLVWFIFFFLLPNSEAPLCHCLMCSVFYLHKHVQVLHNKIIAVNLDYYPGEKIIEIVIVINHGSHVVDFNSWKVGLF